MFRVFVLIALSLLSSGCATSYHSTDDMLFGWMGGYWDRKGPGELTQVGFSANAASDKDIVRKYLMYRCAELTVAENKNYFVMYKTIAHAIRNKPLVKIPFLANARKPGAHVYILMEDTQLNKSYSARQVLKAYSGVVGKS